MKVAFATQDQERVDAHFGWAPRIAVYDVQPESFRHVEDFVFGDQPAEDGDEDKLAPRLAAIGDCAIVYVAAIGGSAAARVVAGKVHPVKVPTPQPIVEILDRLMDVLKGTPPPWLRKALQQGQERRFAFEDEA